VAAADRRLRRCRVVTLSDLAASSLQDRLLRRRRAAVILLAAVLTLSAPALAAAAVAPAKTSRAAARARPQAAPPTPAQELARTAKAPAATTPPLPAPGPLVWAAPVGIDGNPIDALACPSISLCVAVDNDGHAVTSTDPPGGARTWHPADIDGFTSLTGVSCPSISICVAVDSAGDVVSTGNAPGPGAAWAVAKVDTSITEPSPYGGGADLLRGVACPSVSFCVAVDSVGNIAYSGAPTAGAGAWALVHVDDNSDYGCVAGGLTCQAPLMSVSCPAATLCAAADFTGNVLETATPSASSPWASQPTLGGGPKSLWSVSCPSVSFCATVNGTGGDVITWDPATGSPLTTHRLPIDAFGVWCSSSALCLVAGESAAGTAELLGSTDPAAKNPTWDVTDFGDINAVSCPTKSVCVAADNEGEAIVGVTVTSLEATLRTEAMGHIPRIGALVRRRGYTLAFTSPLAGELNVEWALSGAAARAVGDRGAAPLVLATASARFTGAQTQSVHLSLTATGARLLKGTKRMSVTAEATYATNTGTVAAQRKVTLSSR
jgi:hypothetical protein